MKYDIMKYDMNRITEKLNEGALTHRIGNLQIMRAELHHKRSTGLKIFRPKTTFPTTFDGENYRYGGAYHFGGLGELQFNIWLEDAGKIIRHGVGFCFVKSRTLPNPIKVLRARVKYFNTFMRLHPGLYPDMCMWHYQRRGEQPSPVYPPRRIPDNLIIEGAEVWLGKRTRVGPINYEAVLKDFDRLLDLYKFIEEQIAKHPS